MPRKCGFSSGIVLCILQHRMASAASPPPPPALGWFVVVVFELTSLPTRVDWSNQNKYVRRRWPPGYHDALFWRVSGELVGCLSVKDSPPPTSSHFWGLLAPHKEQEVQPKSNWQAEKAEPGNEMALSAPCWCLRDKTPSHEIYYISTPCDTCSALAGATRLNVINASERRTYSLDLGT